MRFAPSYYCAPLCMTFLSLPYLSFLVFCTYLSGWSFGSLHCFIIVYFWCAYVCVFVFICMCPWSMILPISNSLSIHGFQFFIQPAHIHVFCLLLVKVRISFTCKDRIMERKERTLYLRFCLSGKRRYLHIYFSILSNYFRCKFLPM